MEKLSLDRQNVPVEEVIKVFLVIILYTTLMQIVLALCTRFFEGIGRSVLARINEIGSILAAIFICKISPLPQRFWGLRIEKKAVKTEIAIGLVSTILIVGIFFVIRFVYGRLDPNVAARPLFGLYLNVSMRYTYLPSALIQECVSKGVMQHSLERIFPEDKWPLAVLVMACIFSLLHTQVGLYFQLGSIVVAVLTGVLYHYRKNVYACAIIHFLIGFLPRAVGLK